MKAIIGANWIMPLSLQHGTGLFIIGHILHVDMIGLKMCNCCLFKIHRVFRK